MGLFTSETFDSFDMLFKDQLEDIYDAEHRLTEVLPKMADAAENVELAKAIREHFQETESQLTRLERVFATIEESPNRKTCDAMKGLISEAESIVSAKGSAEVRDAGLIAAAQRIEHYEIAAYGCLRNFARRLGHQEAAELFQHILNEEKSADETLTEIAETSVNPQATHA